jgi:hypothetical protein
VKPASLFFGVPLLLLAPFSPLHAARARLEGHAFTQHSVRRSEIAAAKATLAQFLRPLENHRLLGELTPTTATVLAARRASAGSLERGAMLTYAGDQWRYAVNPANGDGWANRRVANPWVERVDSDTAIRSNDRVVEQESFAARDELGSRRTTYRFRKARRKLLAGITVAKSAEYLQSKPIDSLRDIAPARARELASARFLLKRFAQRATGQARDPAEYSLATFDEFGLPRFYMRITKRLHDELLSQSDPVAEPSEL